MKIGGPLVECTVCGLRKAPRGRAVPDVLANSYCERECPGQHLPPWPGNLWPGETSEEFGYPCNTSEELEEDAR